MSTNDYQEEELELETLDTEDTSDNIFDELEEEQPVAGGKTEREKQLEAELAKYKAILARKNKKLETAQTQQPLATPNTTPDNLFKEELTLLAQGYSPELLQTAKVFATGSGSNLTEALNSPALIALKQKEDANKKRQLASMGTSKGSAAHVEQKFSSGMNRDEHKKAFQERLKG